MEPYQSPAHHPFQQACGFFIIEAADAKERSTDGALIGRIMNEAKDYDIHIRLPEPAEAR